MDTHSHTQTEITVGSVSPIKYLNETEAGAYITPADRQKTLWVQQRKFSPAQKSHYTQTFTQRGQRAGTHSSDECVFIFILNGKRLHGDRVSSALLPVRMLQTTRHNDCIEFKKRMVKVIQSLNHDFSSTNSSNGIKVRRLSVWYTELLHSL